MKDPTQANFLLVDGALRQNAIIKLRQRLEPLEIVPLYIGTRWSELHDLGPILVWMRGPSMLIDETFQNALAQADAGLLYSQATMHQLADHLRRFISPPDVHGGQSLLRFADPLVARHWLGSYQGDRLDAILGPIQAWHVPQAQHCWESSTLAGWRSFHRTVATVPKWVEAPLGEVQLNALDQGAHWRFTEQLHHSLEQDHPEALALLEKSTRTQWFNERLAEALAWGLVSERSVAIWIEYSLRWGKDFTSCPDGFYRHWLACTPDALELPPELRIQRMDSDCVINPNNKEVL